VLQCVAVCCNTYNARDTRHGAMCMGVLQCVTVCCSVLQCVAVCYNTYNAHDTCHTHINVKCAIFPTECAGLGGWGGCSGASGAGFGAGSGKRGAELVAAHSACLVQHYLEGLEFRGALRGVPIHG